MTSPQKRAWESRKDARNLYAPSGMHWCSYHDNLDGTRGAYLPKTKFAKAIGRVHDLDSACKECKKKYRLNHEELYGKRNDSTKTVRVSRNVHSIIKRMANERNTSIPQFLKAAIIFYSKLGCSYSNCTEVRGATGRCAKHIMSIAGRE